MTISRISAPDLASLALGGGELRGLRACGFSTDARTLLVRATFTDIADGGSIEHAGIWLHDTRTGAWQGTLNALLAGAGGSPADVEVMSAEIRGAAASATIVAEYATRGESGAHRLGLVRSGALVDPDLFASLIGVPVDIAVERYLLSDDGRFLAVQTRSEKLSEQDFNETSDIYLVDLASSGVDRVSIVEGAESPWPVRLGSLRVAAGVVEIAFSTSGTFSSRDGNESEPAPEARTDAYLWSRGFDALGLTGAPNFTLVSADVDGGTGFVDDAVTPPIATAGGVFFESAAALTAGDSNGAIDAFVATQAGIRRILLAGIGELELGARIVAATGDGRFALLSTASPEVAAASGVAQLVFVELASGAWEMVPSAGQPLDAPASALAMSVGGAKLAITTLASSIDGGTPDALDGALYLALAGFDTNNPPTGAVTLSGTASEGETLHAGNDIQDADGIGPIAYRWLADDVAISGATSMSLALTQAEVGKVVRVEAVYTDLLGNDETVSSIGTGPVANVEQESTGTLTVTGVAEEGGILSASLDSVVDPDGTTSTAYRWQQRSGEGTVASPYAWADIGGTFAASLSIASDESDVGKVVRVVATTIDGFGGKTEFVGDARTVVGVNDAPEVTAPQAIVYSDTSDDDVLQFQGATLPAFDAESGTLSFSVHGGVNGQGKSVLAGTYGTLSIDTSSGAWRFDPDEAAIEALKGESGETFGLLVSDGLAHTGVDLIVTLHGADDAAVFAGTLTGSVREDGTLTASGTATVSDRDDGDSPSFIPAVFSGTYGSFAIDANGAWIYLLDNDSSAVQGLGGGDAPVERFLVSADDGASGAVEITVSGFGEASLGGLAYHWKSHTLLSGVRVQAGGDTSIFDADSQLLDLRGASYDPGAGRFQIEVWMQPVVATSSIDWVVACDTATSAAFTSALDASWSAAFDTSNPHAVRFAAIRSPESEGATGPVRVGVLELGMPPGAQDAVFALNGVRVGAQSQDDKGYVLSADLTGVDGAYALLDLPPTNLRLQALRGTADSGSAISAADALAALRISVGLNPNPDPDGSGPLPPMPVSPYQFIAADVTGDGMVRSSDALAILRMAVRSGIAPAQEWLFVEERRDFWNEAAQNFTLNRNSVTWDRKIPADPLGAPEVNLVGTLKGDVNGSWLPTSGAQDLDVVDPTYFSDLSALIGVPTSQWGV